MCLCRVLLYLKCEVYVWRSSWQPDSDHAACVSKLCDTWNRCSAWYGTSPIQRCQICGTSDLQRHRKGRKNVITFIISKYSLQMILRHHRNWTQQTYNQLKNETGNARLCFFSWGNMLLHINFSSASFFFFLVKAEQVNQKSPGPAPASTYLSHAKSACNYTHTVRRKQEFIEFTETLQMCPAGGRSYSEQTLV